MKLSKSYFLTKQRTFTPCLALSSPLQLLPQAEEKLPRYLYCLLILGISQAFWRHNLAVFSREPMLSSTTGVMQDIALKTSRLQVNLANSHRHATATSKPALDVLRLRPCLEDEPARCIEDAGYNNLSISRSDGIVTVRPS